MKNLVVHDYASGKDMRLEKITYSSFNFLFSIAAISKQIQVGTSQKLPYDLVVSYYSWTSIQLIN